MTWIVTKEEIEGYEQVREAYSTMTHQNKFSPKLNVRAIIDIDNEQVEIKELITALQKHMKEDS